MAEAADNTLMLEILKDIRKEQRDIRKEQLEFRKEQNNQRVLLQLTVDTLRKFQQHTEKRFLAMEERMRALKDDLERMLKSELLGAMANFQARIANCVNERLAGKAE